MADDALSKLARRVWITKGARLNAYRRLELQQRWSTVAVGGLSIFLVGLSCYSLARGQAAASAHPNLGWASVVASVLVLVFSLIEGEQNYRLKADRLHRCAMDLLNLELRLDVALEAADRGAGAIAGWSTEYTNIITKCPENHLPADDSYFRATRGADFSAGWWSRIWWRLAWWARLAPYVAVAIGPFIYAGYLVVTTR